MVQLVRHKCIPKGRKKEPHLIAEKQEKPKKEINIPKLFKNDDIEIDENEFIEINSPEDSRRALDNFFAENDNSLYEYEEKKVHKSNIIYIAAAAFAVLFIVLIIVHLTTAGRLAEANEKITELEGVQEQNEELKMKVLSYEEEVDMLKDGGETLAADEVGGDGGSESGGESAGESGGETSGEYDTYTVVENDSFWTIAEKVYGNGAEYQKILDANHLTENSPIKPGEKLKIPKYQAFDI